MNKLKASFVWNFNLSIFLMGLKKNDNLSNILKLINKLDIR